MARYNAIQIGDIYLTSTGLVGGKPCKTSVNGLQALKPALLKSVIKAIDGTPFSQTSAGKKGIDLEISIDWLAQSVYDDINDIFDGADNDGTTFDLVIAGDGGTFTLDVVPNSDYVIFDKFTNGILQGVKYRVVTA